MRKEKIYTYIFKILTTKQTKPRIICQKTKREDVNLKKDPINTIKVRDVQLFLNSLQEYEKHGYGQVKLKKELPNNINYRQLARENIIDRCSSYELKRQRKSISKQKTTVCPIQNVFKNLVICYFVSKFS